MMDIMGRIVGGAQNLAQSIHDDNPDASVVSYDRAIALFVSEYWRRVAKIALTTTPVAK